MLAEQPATLAPTRPQTATPKGWEAELQLGFARRAEGDRLATRLVNRAHRGPLAFQKPLYPEGEAVCHGILIHPPAGIAGGDHLQINIHVAEGAHALLTTPGAGKWYRSAGAWGSQNIRLEVEAGGVLEWLPQESIVFDEARARGATQIRLAADATLIGQDMICLGRTARGERFTRGRLELSTRIERAGRPLWREAIALDGDDALLGAQAGLAGDPVFGTFFVAHTGVDAAMVEALREIAPQHGRGAITRLPGVLLARWIGSHAEAGRHWFTQLWSALRPPLLGRPAIVPRIWNT
ncbi:urease accessory protein UreD [Niveibacterium sp. SC-1]|uniref:urease accessory protein UreD n=1 Tax=Niveibacterium sp. SC-1 TaxID=3135646 RepID=UPI00311F9032